MEKRKYKKELTELQSQLIQLQGWAIRCNKRVIIILEGRDAAGKGGTAKRILQRLNTNHARIIAKGKPTEKEEKQKYFTRWRKTLPKQGEIVIYDRSWYTRAGVECVMGFASEEEVADFFPHNRKFEKKLTKEGVIILKYWLSITQTEQEKRFLSRLNSPKKRWKLSEMDLKSRSLFDQYTLAKDKMFQLTSYPFAKWNIIDANDKRKGRITLIKHIVRQVPYEPVAFEQKELEGVTLSTKKSKKQHKELQVESNTEAPWRT